MEVIKMDETKLPVEYRPLSPWAYFGYSILFSIPVIGFICLVIFSFSNANINRRNYARSYFCVIVLAIIFVAILIFTGILSSLPLIINK